MIRLSKGPKEHRARPAIDLLFRSAAATRGQEVIGLVMTGALDHGTAALQAIKACGGRVIVQDHRDAFEPSTPARAFAWLDIDASAPPDELPALIDGLVSDA